MKDLAIVVRCTHRVGVRRADRRVLRTRDLLGQRFPAAAEGPHETDRRLKLERPYLHDLSLVTQLGPLCIEQIELTAQAAFVAGTCNLSRSRSR